MAAGLYQRRRPARGRVRLRPDPGAPLLRALRGCHADRQVASKRAASPATSDRSYRFDLDQPTRPGQFRNPDSGGGGALLGKNTSRIGRGSELRCRANRLDGARRRGIEPLQGQGLASGNKTIAECGPNLRVLWVRTIGLSSGKAKYSKRTRQWRISAA